MRLAWLVAALLFLPSTTAFHLSVGADDVVLLAPTEPPANTPSSHFARATATGCAEPGLDPSLATEDGLCGLLRYNQGTTFETVSPADQLSRLGVNIDLQLASYIGTYGISTCNPWCNHPPTYKALHDLGHTLGLTDDGETAWQGDGGAYTVGGNLLLPGSPQALAAAGLPWLLPVTDTSFLAFVTDGAGQAIDAEGLEALVASAKTGGLLPGSAAAQVCAFSPNALMGQHAAGTGFCEVPLTWMGADSADPYGEPCNAPTYLCGAITPAWRGTSVCPMWHAACYFSDAWNSAHHWAVWHGVVAPSPPSCLGAEPGFDTAPTAMLAHDLELFQHPADLTPARGVPLLYDELARNLPGLGELREGSLPDVTGAPLLAPTWQQVKDALPFTEHGPEPNAAPWLGLSESTGLHTESRSLDACASLSSDEEELDPWTNVIDGHVALDVAGLGAPLGAEPEPDHGEGNLLLRVSGMVGIFADVDDDGRYEQSSGEGGLPDKEGGAYPILWDLHPPGEGCQFRDGARIGDLARDAGYRSPTGLVVVLRLNDALLFDHSTGDLLPHFGPQALAFLSSGLSPTQSEVATLLAKAGQGRPLTVYPDAFNPQCDEATGGFSLGFDALVPGAGPGDGAITGAIVTLADPGPGGGAVPPSPIELASGTHVWTDVDPFAST